MMQIKDYRRDVNDVGLAGPLLKIPGSATARRFYCWFFPLCQQRGRPRGPTFVFFAGVR
jgi:hypothetical protein